MKRSLRFLLPLLLFAGIAAFLFRGLGMDPHKVPSPLVDKPAPAFELPSLRDPQKLVSSQDFAGRVSLFNVWATWCVSCRAEHQVLLKLAREGVVDIYGLNYKDDRADALQWLRVLGNPYVENAFDAKGRVAIDWGVYGTPETFVIDRKGIIRYKQIGPITDEVLRETLLPLVEKLKAES